LNHRVVLREVLHRQLANHLLSGLHCGGLQEEACLALWRRGDGFNCYTGILADIVLPEDGDRDLHGNVTLRGYLNRVLDRALKAQAGVAVLHSHPGPGWQALSGMDDDTERNIVSPFVRETGLPLLGLTIGSDGVWSARFWHEADLDKIAPTHCTDVRRAAPHSSGLRSGRTLALRPPSKSCTHRRQLGHRRTGTPWIIREDAQSRRHGRVGRAKSADGEP